MPLFARSDVASIAVPETAGGCGASHSRPVVDGAPDLEWDLERMCMPCARHLRGDPLWSATLAEIPETPDERIAREDAEKRGERALKKAQEQTNFKLTDLTAQVVELLKVQNEGRMPGQGAIAELVAREVAKAVAAQHLMPVQVPAELTDSDPAVLERLHVRTLGKMCRDRGLPDKGSKADLIGRLAA